MGTGAVRIWSPLTREPLALTLCPLPLMLETKDSQCTWVEQLHWTLPKDHVIRGKPVMISTKHGWRERLNDVPGAQWFLMTDFSRTRSYTYQRKLFKELLHTLPFFKKKKRKKNTLSLTIFNQISYRSCLTCLPHPRTSMRLARLQRAGPGKDHQNAFLRWILFYPLLDTREGTICLLPQAKTTLWSLGLFCLIYFYTSTALSFL